MEGVERAAAVNTRLCVFDNHDEQKTDMRLKEGLQEMMQRDARGRQRLRHPLRYFRCCDCDRTARWIALRRCCVCMQHMVCSARQQTHLTMQRCYLHTCFVQKAVDCEHFEAMTFNVAALFISALLN